jgi:hypothetical protein
MQGDAALPSVHGDRTKLLGTSRNPVVRSFLPGMNTSTGSLRLTRVLALAIL